MLTSSRKMNPDMAIAKYRQVFEVFSRKSCMRSLRVFIWLLLRSRSSLAVSKIAYCSVSSAVIVSALFFTTSTLLMTAVRIPSRPTHNNSLYSFRTA